MDEHRRVCIEPLRDWLASARDEKSVRQALRKFANQHGFEWFSYLSLHESNIHGLSSYPDEWQTRYLETYLHQVDPVIAAVRARKEAFAWSEKELSPVSRLGRQFLGEARTFGIRSGVSIPIEGAFGRNALLTFSSTDAKADQQILMDDLAIRSMAVTIDAFIRNSHRGLTTSAGCPLTSSQLECLSWLLSGKSNADIAVLRRTTTRAVEFQLQAIRRSLNVVSTYQAVGLAVQRNWIGL